ncbi:MAG TPA: hypothetical protein VMT54_03770 [Candidatus Cybelea sp.]|nr:hypothetical protein [Candidatus Cybelea sp.]
MSKGLELEVFTRFGTMVDERTRKTIEHGRRIRAVLGQRQFATESLGEQLSLLLAVGERVLDDVPLERVDDYRSALGLWLRENDPVVLALGDQAEEITGDLRDRLKATLSALVAQVGNPAGAQKP